MRVGAQKERIKNTTQIPTPFIRRVLAFVIPAGTGRFKVWVKRGSHGGFSGMAYSTTGYLSLRVPEHPHVFRRIYHTHVGKGYMDWKACTFEEALVALLAHEARHIWQRRHPNGRRVWGSKGQMSERDADAYAIRKMREWRRTQEPRALVRPALQK